MIPLLIIHMEQAAATTAISAISTRLSSPTTVQTTQVSPYSFDLSPPLPSSFWQGLRDCADGNTVDLDRALDDTPPSL
jgi:hypothetical protein